MEELPSDPDMGNDRSAQTAEILRLLREHADDALTKHRRHLSDIESDINERLQEISDEIARDRAAEEVEAAKISEIQSKSDELESELNAASFELEELRQQLEEQSVRHQEHLDQRDEELGQLIEQAEEAETKCDQLQQLVDEKQKEFDDISQQLQSTRQSLEEKQNEKTDEVAHLQEQLVEAENKQKDNNAEISELNSQNEYLQDQLSLLEQSCEELRNQESIECKNLRDELNNSNQAKADLETKLSDLEHRIAETDNANQELKSQTEELTNNSKDIEELETQLAELNRRLTESEQTNEELKNLADESSQRFQQERETLEQSCEDLQQQLDETRTCNEGIASRESEMIHQLEEAEAKNQEAVEMLRIAEQRIIELGNTEDHQHEMEQLNRKFELALADVHKLKRENNDLQAELASRPAANDEESPEMFSLRAERDALATKIAELEKAPPQYTDVDSQQELADLQRRFELAVEDVRELKLQNTELQQQLQSGSISLGASDAGGSDWESQKAKLLAELGAEDQASMDPDRRDARATIEGTIAITDQIVAEKDKELAELKAAMNSTPDEVNLDEIRKSVAEEVLGNDDIIQEERKRLEEMQEEWQDKLRKAELELSVQRAKLSREQSELQEKLAVLTQAEKENTETETGKPRRRWLSALGLKEDEDQED